MSRRLLTQKISNCSKCAYSRNISSVNVTKFADIVISGGGMVGTAMACALGKLESFNDRKVILLETSKEAEKHDWSQKPYENRVSAITPGSSSFLRDIGVWDRVTRKRCNPFNSMQVWEGCGNGSISFDSSDIGSPYISHIVENNAIIESCGEQAKECKSVEMMYQTRLTNYTAPDSSASEKLVTLEASNGEKIATKLLVAADGFNSFIRTNSGIKTIDYDYGQSAVVATIKVKTPLPNKTAWQRYLTSGPVALLPLSDEWSSLVWSTSKDKAKELMQLSDSEFVENLNEAFTKPNNSLIPVNALADLMKNVMSTIQPGKYASNVSHQVPMSIDILPKSRGMFPLGMKHSTYYVKSRIALIGDSAHRIHPMAGQGVNLGFGDVKSLVENIDKSCRLGRDLGALENLLPYETERQRHVLSIIGAINGLNMLFSTDAFPVVFARTLGLTMTDSVLNIKEQIIRHAMR